MTKSKPLSAREKRERLEKDVEYRKELFRKLQDHVAQGFSVSSFEHLSEHSIKKYCEEFPEEFLIDDLEESMRKSKTFWEGIGLAQAQGKCLGNSRSWIYNMANRFGWREKQEIEAKHEAQVQVSIVDYAGTKTLTDTLEK